MTKENELLGLLKWAGSKDKLSRRMLAWGTLSVPHSIYVEPFAGSAETYFHKSDSPAVISDIDPDLIGLFRTLRDNPEELIEAIGDTPYAYDSWEYSRQLIRTNSGSPVERACAFFVTINQGFTGRPRQAFGHYDSPSCAARIPTYWKLIDQLHLHSRKLQNAEILHSSYEDVLSKYDSPNSLIYLDPPYLSTVRLRGYERLYHHEMLKPEEHIEMLTRVNGLSGMVMLSGYNCELYRRFLPHWEMMTYDTFVAMKAMRRQYHHPNQRKRRRVTEIVWCNPALRMELELGNWKPQLAG